MKITCNVIKDLLPLYVENLLSDDSKKLVEEHIENCRECYVFFENLKKENESCNVETEIPLKKVRKDIERRKGNSIMFFTLIACFLALTLFSYTARPRYLNLEDSGIKITETQGGKLEVGFSDLVTAVNYSRDKWDDGVEGITIEAWYSVLDRFLNKSKPVLVFSIESDKVGRIYYTSNQEEKNSVNTHFVYGSAYHGGSTVLPRLVMGFYFRVALIDTAVTGLIWLIANYKKWNDRYIKLMFFIPVSYVLSNLILGINLISYSPVFDFTMAAAGTVFIFLIIYKGSILLEQHRRDLNV